MKYFFTSDLHLGHANIIKYCGRTIFMTKKDKNIYKSLRYTSKDKQRLFKISNLSLNKMNKGLIRNWNERVKKEDIIFHIGDFCFKKVSSKKSIEWEKLLNGKVIHIEGNHDSNNSTKTIIKNLVIKYSNKKINLVHNPTHADYYYNINFVGHVHNLWKFKRIKTHYGFTDLINVGTDVWNYYPVTFNEIMKEYNQWLNKEIKT